jgi:hypothetical protein
VPISAVDSVTPAIEHTKEQLFRPFRFGQWTRLALVGLFAGEIGSGGGCNFQLPGSTGTHHRSLAAFPAWDPALLIPLVLMAVIVIPVLWLLFIYINSRMRFVLFDSIIAKKCEIRRMWRERGGPALQYFVWQITFSAVTLGGIILFIGLPALTAFALGWFSAPREHLIGLILGGIAMFFLFLGLMLLFLLIHVFTKDFVVPQMALEGISAFEGWRRLLKLIDSERSRYAGYAGMKLILSIGAAFAVGIVAIILILVLLIPIGGLGLISVLLGQGAGLTWNALTITLAVVAGSVVLVLLLYVMSLISVPVIVFFPAYAMQFFAARYPLLAAIIYPAPARIPPAAQES